jgi:ribonuclease HI
VRYVPARHFIKQGSSSNDEGVQRRDSMPALGRADGSGGAAAASSSYPSAASSSAPAAAASGRHRYAVSYCDGAAKSNPVGDAGAGVVLYDWGGEFEEFQDDRPLASLKRYLGVCSSVEAEYEALILCLRLAREHDITHLTVRMDNEIVVKQMRGEYEVRAEHLKPLYRIACDLIDRFIKVKFEHIRRQFNAEADALANEAVQEGRGY